MNPTKHIIVLLLERIEESISLIQSQMGRINSANDFLLSPDGMFTLSGICMQLIFIGESVKSIDHKTNKEYLKNYPQIPWGDIMGLRDIIAHEYHRIDEEEIYKIITHDLELLLQTVQQMKKEFISFKDLKS